MGWGDIIGGFASLGGTAYSIYQGERAADRAEEHAESASQISDKQAKLADRQIQLSEDQWDRYIDIFGPLEERQVEEALYDMEVWRPYKNELLNDLQRNVELMRPIKEERAAQELENLEMYRPLEEAMVQDAVQALNPEQRARVVGEEFERERALQDSARLRQMRGYGVDPGSGRFASANATADVEAAARKAALKNDTRMAAEDVNRNVRNQALNYYRGYAMNPTYSTPGVTPANASGDGMRASALGGFGNASASLGAAQQGQMSLAGMAGNAAASDWNNAMYNINTMFRPTEQGGVNWQGAADTMSGLFRQSAI